MEPTTDNFGAERKGRRGELDYRYDFLFHWAAESCSITKQDVIDSLLQDVWVRDIHDFVLKDTKRTVLLFYQPFRDPNARNRLEKSLRPSIPSKSLVVVSDDRKFALDGVAVYYFKLNVKKMLTEDNVHRDLMVGMVDAVDDELLSNFVQLLHHIYRPALESLLFFADEGPEKSRVYEEVLMAIQSLYSSLKVSENILQHDITLLAHRQLYLDLPHDPKKRADLIRDPNTVAQAEKIATEWLSMIERENCESEMLRRDSDEDSPRDEIEYWKTRSTRLNLIQQQFNTSEVALVVQCLNINRSKMMKRWVDALRKLTHCCHEANNNTLYLNDFEHHCKTLYVWDPIRLLPTINQLLSTVRLICCVSLYYNTSERITSLLVKITNELIRSCRRHITNHGRETVWSRPASVVKPLLEDCLNLHTAYRNAYAQMKQDLETYQKSVQQTQQNNQQTAREQATLTCSEHSVFGKFDAFCARLKKILRLYDVIEKHENLLKSRMEGLLQEEDVMEEILRRYHAAVKDITSRPYDYLNYRYNAFDQHMAEFEARLNDLKLYVGSYLERAYDPVWETAQAMRFLQKFQRIGRVIPVVAMEVKHQRILNQLLADMDKLTRVIYKYGDEPPMPRNFSTTTGKMMWFSTLQRCLELRLEEHAPILNSELGRQVFRRYKNLLVHIVQLGSFILRSWILLSSSDLEQCMAQTILTPNVEQPHLFSVNFNPKIITFFQEIHCACQAGIRIPPGSGYFFSKIGGLLKMKDEAQYLVENHRQLLDTITQELKPLMCCHVHQLYLTLRPAAVSLTWNIKPTKWSRFFNQCRKSMVNYKLLCERLEDIRQNQLDRILDSLRFFSLLPDCRDRTWTPEEFVEAVKEMCRKVTSEIQQRNWLLENGVLELIDLIRVKDPVKFFHIPTEEIVRSDSKASKRAMGSRQSSRPKSTVDRQNKARAAAECSSDSGSAKKGSAGSDRAREQPSGDFKGLPPLNPAVTGKPPPSPRKSNKTSTKLPKLNSNKKTSPTKETRHQPTSLPPLTPRSNASSSSLQDDHSRKNSLASYEGTREDSSEIVTTDYSFLIVQLDKAMVEWKRLYSKRILHVIVTWLRSQLDLLRYSVVPSNYRAAVVQQNQCAMFLLHAQLNYVTIELSPSLDDIQEVIHSAGKIMLCLAKGIKRWQNRAAMDLIPQSSSVQKHNIYVPVSENKEIVKGLNLLSTCLIHVKSSCSEQLRQWEKLCKEICCFNRRAVVKNFVDRGPSVWDWDQHLRQFRQLEDVVEGQTSLLEFGPIHVSTTKLQSTLLQEISEWTEAYTSVLYRRTLRDMERLMVVFGLLDRKLDRKIRDLEDTRIAMDCLRDIRLQEVEFDMSIELIEEAIGIMMKYHVPLTEEDVERVDAVRMTWHRLQQRSLEHHCNLVAIQPNFRQELLDNLSQFRVDCAIFCTEYDSDGPMIQGLSPREASDRLLLFQNRFDALWRRLTSYEGGAELFGLTMPDVPELNRIRKELNLLQKLYRLYNDVIDRVAAYHDMSWNNVNIEDINNELIEFQNRCRKLPKGLKEWPAFAALKRTIDEFSDLCPLLELMTNKAMKPRHWVRLTEITGHVFHVELEGFCLRQVVEAPLLQHKEDVEDVCISALKEKDIEAKLRQVTNDWTTNQLTFTTFKNRGELLLRGDSAAELISMLEDSLMVLSSLLSNRYNVPFRKQIQKWVTDLSNTNEILERWLMVQNLWVYLEAVFVGGDIAKQLPKEAKRFHKIDKSWQRLMARAHETSNVVICCVGDETMSQLLPHLQEELELCQKSLSGYLEKKRLSFPRFFFVSDPALLEILGQASDSHTIQSHLLSIFDNTACVRFHEQEYDKILAIVSTEGESIALEQPVRAEGSVELWLMRLLQEAHRSLHSIIRLASQAIQNTEFNLLEFLAAFPSQVGILGLQMLWTRDAEAALAQSRYDRKVMQETNAKFLEILNTLIEQTTKNLDRLERIKFETLITIHVHQRDIFDHLCRTGVRSVTDFEWIRQFRFYFKPEHDQMAISITDVSFTYQNEFLGCTERLVITPLTDRCYITLAQALNMCMGGCPSGPAGTGKTETTKDMGKTLGKYVVVFNCSDQMDFRGLGRIYKGLAQSGSWGCFDEFNRIELAVLSVAAQQIAVVLACKREKRRQFVFTDGDGIEMNPEFGIFLTMNPNYAGRQQLPENLKNQFRFVSMMVPDRQIIIRVKLASCGFLENITLARKFYTLYKLCEEQLTKQVHYDFGLRNILSVLRTLGATKRQSVRDSESMIVMRVLRDMNLSKLVDEDEPLFMSLIGDLFPTTALEKTAYGDLDNAIREQCRAAGLIPHPQWLLKLIQLYETQLVRHGIMTLGPTGSGKTTCIQVLMKALSQCGQPHREMRMNPKAISAAQMFGRLDVATNDWTDGIFSALWRKTLRTKRGEHIWLVLDGPVDSLWIENLNSVLDDNRTLTLANGDRLPMSPYCKIIFEPHNIDNASPATVSRCGMVYMSSSGLDWRPLLSAWLLKRPQGEVEIFKTCFEESFAPIYQWTRQNTHYVMEVLEFNVINQTLALLEGLIPGEDNDEYNAYDRPIQAATVAVPAIREPEQVPEDPVLALDLKAITDAQPDVKTGATPRATRQHLERLYVFAVVWSVGAFLEKEDRIKMSDHVVQHFSHLNLPPVKPDSDETLFDYVVEPDGEWNHWRSHVQEFTYPDSTVIDFGSMLVPNVDSVRTEFLIHTIAKQGKPVLLIGEQGSAKTVMINAYLKKHKNDDNLVRSLNFSSATTTYQFQRTIEACVDKRMGNTYGPPAGKRLTVFIDDVNLPQVNEWGDQSTNEIVRQLLEMKGFYSLEKPGDFTNIVDLRFLAAMIHPGGGRNDIPQRLKRHFCIFNCPLPSNTSMDKVFGTIAMGHFSVKRGFCAEVRELVEKLVPLTRLLWMSTKARMLPTPAKFHYIFNLRDLSRIWQGMSSFLCNVIDNAKILMAAWKHEVTRVIADRFTTQEDKDWFEKELIHYVTRYLGDEYTEYVLENHYFVDFMRDAPEPTGDETEEVDMELPKVYEPVQSLDDLQDRLNMFLSQYNEMIRGHGMDLVFFQDAVEHLIKISRILRHPGGNVLLVGVGGSGKQSLTKLASFIAGYKTFHVTLTRSYNVGNFLEDLKVLYRTCGIQGKGTTFIFTDQDVKEEAFLEYLNSVLSSGVVSNLFNRDEQAEIVSELTPIMKREFPKKDLTTENVMEYFMTRVRQHLHIALCFSPVGEKFRQRSFKFPGLISGCTLDWFQPWPREALVAVAQHFLKDFALLSQTDLLHEVENALGSIQECVAETAKEYFQRFRRSTHVTPKTYLSFLSSYKSVFTSKASEIGGMATRIETGLAKLQDASETVEKLKTDLAVMEQELAKASETAEKVLVEVTHRAKEAETTKNHVQLAKDRAQRLVDVIAADKEVAEAKLEDARPALEEAEAALNTIKPAHIATVRKLGRPPPLIMRIMDAVLILFQRKIQPVIHEQAMGGFKPSWNESLKMMASTMFLQQLQNFPKDTICDETVELLEPYFRSEDYNMETARRVCGDVAGLLSWTRAMSFFFTVNKEVLPLKANLALQEVRLAAAMCELSKAEAILSEKESALDFVTSQYDAAMGDKRRLTEAAAVCRRKMATAAALISGLSGEKLRWTLQCRALKEQMGRLVGDAILATAFLSYAGPFNQEFRTKLMHTWKKTLKNREIPFTPTLNVVNMMADNVQTAEWTLQGLPSDEHSIQNAVIVVRSHSYPLLIDPQGQGKNWIKAKEGNNELQITSLNHKYFRAHLDDALSLGRPLLIEDVGEELDPVLDNLLNKNFIKAGSQEKVIIGDKDCDIMAGFTLYITTKLPNPAYTPEVSSKVTMIDFTVTQKGLEDQLLARVVSAERSELEAERVSLFESVMENKRLIQQLEDNLLFRLTSTSGSLIDDEDLLSVLHDTKVTAQEVNHKLVVSAEMEHKINTAREEFRPVATRGSILYFLIVEMSHVNVMYQTSLKQFLHLFDGSLSKAMRTPNIVERVNSILSTLNREVWAYTLRGLYEQHQFLFTLLMAIKIDLHAGNISHAEFMKLIKGGASLDLNTAPPKPFKWILDAVWLNLVELSTLHPFTDLLQQIHENEREWRSWVEKERPELEEIPCGYSKSLSHVAFRKLLLIRSWCPDRMLQSATNYVVHSLGHQFIDAPLLDLEQMWSESEPRVPLICVLTTGSDPSIKIEQLARQKDIEIKALSMGQGQEIHARRLLADSMGAGNWLLLQNCHLNLAFCNELLESLMEGDTIHAGFRLWITTEVHPHFPISLLQTAIKFTNEPPQGIRASLKRTFSDLPQDLLDYSPSPAWPTLVYTVAFLHTVLLERRKYGPLGWNTIYEFNQSDLMGAIQCVQNHLDDMDPRKGISWPTICFMIGEAQYGGRVTDDFDKRLLLTFTSLWFSERLLQPGFEFYQNYGLPAGAQGKSIGGCMEHVSFLPATDSPHVLGLDSNAEITYQMNRAQAILDTILSIQPKEGGNIKGETRESVVYRLCDDMLEKMPKNYVEHEVKEALNRMGALMPMSIFLRQEIDRMHKVITTVRKMLVDLKLAIEGTIIMSPHLLQAMDSMFDARVPEAWKAISWESSTLGFWFTEFLERNAQFVKWCFQAKPKVFWIAGFFNPQGFLTAMRQEVTRAHRGWALDSVVLQSVITRLSKEEVAEHPAEGVYIHGMYLEGASLDRKTGRLVETKGKILYEPMPVIYVYAINSTAGKDPKMYECPIYRKPMRSTSMYIGSIDLETDINPKHWTLRGVALLCDIK